MDFRIFCVTRVKMIYTNLRSFGITLKPISNLRFWPHQTGIAGHSLGAARALIAAGLLTAAKRPPERVLALGCPKPGFQKLSDLILAGGYPVMCVRNGPDPVAAVPLTLPDLPYCKPVADTAIHEPPADPADPFAWHHVQLYLDGVRKLAAIAS